MVFLNTPILWPDPLPNDPSRTTVSNDRAALASTMKRCESRQFSTSSSRYSALPCWASVRSSSPRPMRPTTGRRVLRSSSVSTCRTTTRESPRSSMVISEPSAEVLPRDRAVLERIRRMVDPTGGRDSPTHKVVRCLVITYVVKTHDVRVRTAAILSRRGHARRLRDLERLLLADDSASSATPPTTACQHPSIWSCHVRHRSTIGVHRVDYRRKDCRAVHRLERDEGARQLDSRRVRYHSYRDATAPTGGPCS